WGSPHAVWVSGSCRLGAGEKVRQALRESAGVRLAEHAVVIPGNARHLQASGGEGRPAAVGTLAGALVDAALLGEEEVDAPGVDARAEALHRPHVPAECREQGAQRLVQRVDAALRRRGYGLRRTGEPGEVVGERGEEALVSGELAARSRRSRRIEEDQGGWSVPVPRETARQLEGHERAHGPPAEQIGTLRLDLAQRGEIEIGHLWNRRGCLVRGLEPPDRPSGPPNEAASQLEVAEHIAPHRMNAKERPLRPPGLQSDENLLGAGSGAPSGASQERSEERRVGKECRSRW